MNQASPDFDSANPHLLNAILQAGDRGRIVAHEDIVDERGVKLWARGQPISASLQQRLLDRKLRQPLEACLRAEDGVTHLTLIDTTKAMWQADPALAMALSPWRETLVQDIPRLPLHPAVTLLLTTAQAQSPVALEHAVQAMLLAGAMALHAGTDRLQVRLSMLGGLVHDLGELYLQPELRLHEQHLTPEAFRQLIVHPKVGEMLLTRLTDYPADLARAVGEHHERGTGGGYPTRSRRLSWLGARLAATETLCGILSRGGAQAWQHASLALRLVPGEYDSQAQSFVSQALRRCLDAGMAAPAAEAEPAPSPAEVWARGQALRSGIERSLTAAQALSHHPMAQRLDTSVQATRQALEQLQLACNALGLWAEDHTPQTDDIQELAVANQELMHRVQALRRLSTWMDASLEPAGLEMLDTLWAHAGLPPASDSPAGTCQAMAPTQAASTAD